MTSEGFAMQSTCPSCQTSFEAPEGQPIVCPRCGQQTDIPSVQPMVMPYAEIRVTKTKGLAIAAMVLGLCGLVPFLGVLPALVGVVLGIVSLATARPGKGMAITGIVSGSLGLLFTFSSVWMHAGGSRTLANQSMCLSNLRSLGNAAEIYKNNNNYVPAANLNVLVLNHYASNALLKCPSKKSSTGVDYFYFPLKDSAPYTAFMACDLAGNHKDGRGVVTAGISAKFLSEKDFQAALTLPENTAFAAALKAAEGGGSVLGEPIGEVAK
jgi:hypothetical protein